MSAAEAFLWRGATPVSRAQFLRDAASIAARLPAGPNLFNLCEQREAFLLAFAASVLARRTQLMPSARTDAALAELAAGYGQPACIRDEDIQRWRENAAAPAGEVTFTAADDDHPLLVGFTSGSTGASQPHAKTWRMLLASARLNSGAMRATLGLEADAPMSIVGTVPSHHMYGLELTVLLPLLAHSSVHAERPLFPADVSAALSQPVAPRVLVSTPLHLRALAESGISFPAIDLIVSATAPLDAALARHVESRLGAPLLEMFGATETFVFADRRTARQQEWRLYDGVEIHPDSGSTRVSAAWFARAQQLQDVLEPRGARGFTLLGRNSDLVEVAGKRASLADITRRLCAIAGVEDAVAFQPEAGSGAVNRVAAVVVSRGADARQIAEQLAQTLDAVFVPRPLVLVPRIPRDHVGKVSRAQLLELVRRASQ
jgi:acyl-coenzyme A synthetase/AMP-(fatty) acid ligase